MAGKEHSRAWTQREANFIAEHINEMSFRELAKELKITYSRVMGICRHFGISRDKKAREERKKRRKQSRAWTLKEREYIKAHVDTMSDREIAKNLKIKPSRVRAIIQNYGIFRSEEGLRLAKERQREYIKKRYEEERERKKQGLPPLTGLKIGEVYTEKEIEFVRANYPTMTVRKLAQGLDTTYWRVKNLIHRFGIKKNTNN